MVSGGIGEEGGDKGYEAGGEYNGTHRTLGTLRTCADTQGNGFFFLTWGWRRQWQWLRRRP